MNKYILKSALISEKSFAAASNGKFTFLIGQDANKENVAEIVKELFDVTVMAVNIINIPGKVKRSKKGSGQRSETRKAIVTLKKGEKIDLFEIEKDDVKKETGGKVPPSSPTGRSEKTEKSKDTTVKVREKMTTHTQGDK